MKGEPFNISSLGTWNSNSTFTSQDQLKTLAVACSRIDRMCTEIEGVNNTNGDDHVVASVHNPPDNHAVLALFSLNMKFNFKRTSRPLNKFQSQTFNH